MTPARSARIGVLLAGALAPGVAVGGGGSGGAEVAYKVISLDGVKTGWIVGRCRITPIVERWSIETKKCRKEDPSTVPTERMVASADGGLGDCLVHLREIAAGKDWPVEMRGEDRSAGLAMTDRRYVPHVRAVRAATQLVFTNSGACDGNVHAFLGGDTTMNFALEPGRTRSDVAEAFLERTGTYAFRDDCRPHFGAYVHVMPHPYFAVTSAESTSAIPSGGFGIADVPPGEYDVVCRHEGMSEDLGPTRPSSAADVVLTKHVTIGPGATVVLSFDLLAPEERVRK